MGETGGILEIKIDRGPCFGTCPVYRLTLRADGTASWFGDRFVEPLGHASGTFDETKFRRLAEFIERVGFFSWDREYLPLATCGDSREIAVVTSDGTWTVEQDGTNPDPPRFESILRRAERMAATMTWRQQRGRIS